MQVESSLQYNINIEELNRVPTSSRYVIITYQAADFAKRLGFGIFWSVYITPLSAVATLLTTKVGLIPEISNLDIQITSKMMNRVAFGTCVIQIGILIPIFEEVIFRGLIQDVLLKRVPRYVVKKIAPEKETVLDSTVAKIARITITATLFSAYHLINLSIFPYSYVCSQLVYTFVLGIGCGILKESKTNDLPSCIGGHIANNMMAILLM